MNIYKISQWENRGYDTYDSAIVAAENEEEARKIHPCTYEENIDGPWWQRNDPYSTWCFKLEHVTVELIGVAQEGIKSGVILASFNAG